MALRCGSSIISWRPFAICVIEVPKLYTPSLQNLVAQLLRFGVPWFSASESAYVRPNVGALKANVAEDWCESNVPKYHFSFKSHDMLLVPVCFSFPPVPPFRKISRYLAYHEGRMSCIVPVKIFLYLFHMVPVSTSARISFLLWDSMCAFCSMLSTRFVRECNVVLALLMFM